MITLTYGELIFSSGCILIVVYAVGHHVGYYKAWDWWWKKTKELRKEAGWDPKAEDEDENEKSI